MAPHSLPRARRGTGRQLLTRRTIQSQVPPSSLACPETFRRGHVPPTLESPSGVSVTLEKPGLSGCRGIPPVRSISDSGQTRPKWVQRDRSHARGAD